jgi:antitoxin (DNA-binding transcriptional repressor) of toxin-antitoxin stability system
VRRASSAMLKAHLSEYVDAARAGEEVIVTDRNKPLQDLVRSPCPFVITGQLVQRAAPAFRMRVSIFDRAKTFVAQRPLRLAAQVLERDRDEGLLCVLAVTSPGEDQTPRLVDRPEHAANGQRLPAGQVHDDAIAAAHTRFTHGTSQGTPSGPIEACHSSRLRHAPKTCAGGASSTRVICTTVLSIGAFIVSSPLPVFAHASPGARGCRSKIAGKNRAMRGNTRTGREDSP